MGLLLDLYENFRKTETNVKSTKPLPKKYDFNAGFSGDKKKDYASIKNTSQPEKTIKNKKKKQEPTEHDER